MEALFTALTTSIPSTKILAFLIDMTWKSSCILLFTYTFTKLFRRLSSATRHVIWSMAVAGILLLPMFSLLLPAWPVTVPVTFSSNIALDSGTQLPKPSSITQEEVSSVSSERTIGEVTSEGAVRHDDESTRREAGPNASPSSPQKARILQFVGTIVATHGILIIVSVWSLGMIAVFLRQLVGKTLVVWIALRAEKITDSSLLKLADELRRKHGIKRRVRFLKSMKAGMPMTWGFYRPTILLPGEADAWSKEHQRFVLVHELAHVKRWDCLTQLLAQLSKTLYWFNPLVWIAHREFLKEREHACDDAVLKEGSKASEYAGLLLDIAQSMKALQFASLATVAMARRSQLEGRLLAILDPQLSRRALTRLAVLLTGVVALSVILPLSAMHPVAVKSQFAEDVTVEKLADTTDGASSNGLETKKSTPAKRAQTQPAHPRREGDTPDNTVKSPSQQIQTTQNSDAQIILSLTQVLHDPSLEVRIQAAETLGKMENPSAVQALISALKDENWKMRVAVAEALGDIHDRASVDALIAALGDPDWQVQQAAAEALGDIEDARAVEALGRALQSENRNVRLAVVDALGDIEDRRAFESLAHALKDDDWEIRKEAADALGSLEDPAAIKPLSQALNDSNWEVRKEAVDALGDIEDRKVIEPLSLALKDPHWEIRQIAAEALGDIEDSSVLDPLRTAIHDKNVEVRKAAIESLGDTEDPRAVQVLIPLLSDNFWEIRMHVVDALGEIEDPSAAPALYDALKDENREVRKKAIWAIGEIGDRGAVEPLIQMLTDEDWEIRKMAARALGEIGDSRAMEPLSSRLKDENEDVRQAAAKALGEIEWNNE